MRCDSFWVISLQQMNVSQRESKIMQIKRFLSKLHLKITKPEHQPDALHNKMAQSGLRTLTTSTIWVNQPLNVALQSNETTVVHSFKIQCQSKKYEDTLRILMIVFLKKQFFQKHFFSLVFHHAKLKRQSTQNALQVRKQLSKLSCRRKSVQRCSIFQHTHKHTSLLRAQVM